ncbi:MAG TPA: hypothetical protein VFB12_09695 [Ktedonobacteraceae bacterium]|nr:hypothetical protein [Ktedonobacteraceae bacterium]
MGFNMDLYEKAREEHYQDLRREAENNRLLAQLPQQRRSLSRYAVGKLGVLLLNLGTWLKGFEQSPTTLEP